MTIHPVNRKKAALAFAFFFGGLVGGPALVAVFRLEGPATLLASIAAISAFLIAAWLLWAPTMHLGIHPE